MIYQEKKLDKLYNEVLSFNLSYTSQLIVEHVREEKILK